ncbi:MAG: LamG domain-containing protein [Candidatus Paceibacterota bacterium]|jgi:prepilin-type N-terminal cleavage/methylation domain-containing protein
MNKSFTLIEILVVIVIIGIISAFIIVSMAGVSDKATIAKGQAFSNSLKNALMLNLVSEWKFEGPTAIDGTATTDDAKDTWGSNNASSVNGNPAVKGGSSCISGKCLYFDGTGDSFSIPDSATLDTIFGTENFTLEAWVYSVKLAAFQGIINKRTSSAYAESIGGIFIDNDGDTLRFLIGTGSSMNSITYSLTDYHDKWIHVVGTAGAGYIKLYINGLQSGSPVAITADMPQNNEPMTIGGFYFGYRCFSGRIDEVRIYNNPIPTSLIKENYYSDLNKLLISKQIDNREIQERLSQLK